MAGVVVAQRVAQWYTHLTANPYGYSYCRGAKTPNFCFRGGGRDVKNCV